MSTEFISLERIKELEARRNKSIPSKVFFNHFFALQYHIEASINRFELGKVTYYNQLTLRNDSFEIENVKKLLWNAWSTEMAYTFSTVANNYDYYRFALHWNFPQAYYSVYLVMTAFHETQGVANDNHEKSIKVFGNSVKDGHYPDALSFYSKGLHEEFEIIGLEHFDSFSSSFSGLSRIESLEDAHRQIARFLKTTRKRNAIHKRERLKTNNDRRFHTSKGKFTEKFFKKHWDLIYRTIPETSLLNILYRLRIKANYRDIETFMNAEIDFKQFHESLGVVVDYLNYVHEAYIYKVIGHDAFKEILNGFLDSVGEIKAKSRFEQFSN